MINKWEIIGWTPQAIPAFPVELATTRGSSASKSLQQCCIDEIVVAESHAIPDPRKRLVAGLSKKSKALRGLTKLPKQMERLANSWHNRMNGK